MTIIIIANYCNKNNNVSIKVSQYIPYLPVYKSIFYSLKIGPKNRCGLIHGSKTEIKKSSGQISHVTIAYLKENSKIKDKFFKGILTRNKKNVFFGSKMGVDLYTGSTCTGVNTVLIIIINNFSTVYSDNSCNYIHLHPS